MNSSIEEIFRRRIVSVGFARRIDLLGATTLGVGALMGAGIYVLLGLAAGESGSAVWLAYLACTLLVLPSLAVFVELSKKLPIAGGGYVFAYHGLGSFGGFMTGWVLALGSILACSMYAIGFAYYLDSLIGYPLPEGVLRLVAGVLVLILTAVNCRGTEGGDRIQRIFTGSNLLILLVLVIFSLPEVEVANARPLMGRGLSGIASALSIIYISFFGYQLIANTAEEVIDPEKTVPRAMALSVLISSVFYVMIALVAVLVIPWRELAESKAPLVEVASQSLGPWGWVVIGLGGVLASAAALNGTLLSQGRQIYGMGKDRFLPSLLGRIHEGRQTPQAALFLGGWITIVAVVLGSVESIAKIANFCFLTSMILVSISLRIIYRNSPPRGRLRLLKQVIPELSVLTNLGLLLTIDWVSATLGLQVVLVGLLVYLFYSRNREVRARVGMSVVLLEHRERSFRRRPSILVPMANPATQEAILRLSESLLVQSGGDIVLLSVVTAPEQTDLSSALTDATPSLEILERSTELVDTEEVDLRPVLRVSRSLSSGIIHAAVEEGCNLIVMGYSAEKREEDNSLMELMLRNAPVDIVALRLITPFPPRRIAVALGGRVNLALMVRVAGAVAEKYDAALTFLHILPSDYTREQKQEADDLLLEAIRSQASRALYRIDVLTSDKPLELMVEKSAEFDLLVVGTTKISVLERATVGSFTTQLVERSRCSVVIVRAISMTQKAFTRISETFRPGM